VRWIPLVLTIVVLGACSSSPDCADVVDHVIEVKKTISKTSPADWAKAEKLWRGEMMPFCRDKLTDEDRRCMLAIHDMDDLRACQDAFKKHQ
jgi:hypothetical protein